MKYVQLLASKNSVGKWVQVGMSVTRSRESFRRCISLLRRNVWLGWLWTSGVGVLKDLLDKSIYIRWNNGVRVERFMAVSKSGFTRKAVGYARAHNIILLTPEGIRKIVA